MADNDQVANLEGQVTDLETQLSKIAKQLEAATTGGGDQAEIVKLQATLDEVTKALETTIDLIDKQDLEKSELKVLARLSDAHREIYKAFSEEDKAKFKEMKEEEQDECMTKAIAKRDSGDETVVIEGEKIRKSVVGEASFKIFQKQAARIKATEDEMAKVAKEATKVRLEKRADDEFAHVPGTAEERGLMLGAIEKMEKPLQDAFLKVFKQSEAMGKAGFATLGHDGKAIQKKDEGSSDIKKAKVDFEAKVAEIKKRDNCSNSQATSKARVEFPDLFKAFQGGGAQVN